jgi:hypothetical protein
MTFVLYAKILYEEPLFKKINAVLFELCESFNESVSHSVNDQVGSALTPCTYIRKAVG